MSLRPPVIAILAILAIPLAGCEAKYKHVADHRVGGECEVLLPLGAHGVSDSLGNPGETDYISIWNPGSSGPERTFVLQLKPGTKMRILGARECTNCPFQTRKDYQVATYPEPVEFSGKPAFVRAEVFSTSELRCSEPVQP